MSASQRATGIKTTSEPEPRARRPESEHEQPGQGGSSSGGPNRFDPAKFRVSPGKDLSAADEITLALQIERPPRQQYIRVRQEDGLRQEDGSPVDVYLLHHVREDIFYLVAPQIVPNILEEVRGFT